MFLICIWIVYDIEKIWYKPKTRTIYIKNTWYALDISGVHGQEKGYERCYRFACPFTFAVEQKMHWSTKTHHPLFRSGRSDRQTKNRLVVFLGAKFPRELKLEFVETRIVMPNKTTSRSHNIFSRIWPNLGHSEVVESAKDLQGYLMTCCKTYFLRIFLDLTCDLPERFCIF